MRRQKEREVTLYGFAIIAILIAVVAAAIGGFEVWWINQPSPSSPSSPSSTLLDINTATVRELTTLLGIDQSTAEKIVTERPYIRSDDLVEKNIIPQATYDKIKDQIVASQK
ncbi:MAG: helix-hairpin-helix domain-containing protein [Nitrospirota bacterium]|nr:helix-hairpin-helix domain-containing protein [Nitrospirota bacterium]